MATKLQRLHVKMLRNLIAQEYVANGHRYTPTTFNDARDGARRVKLYTGGFANGEVALNFAKKLAEQFVATTGYTKIEPQIIYAEGYRAGVMPVWIIHD